jgi:hypothetical protein
MKMDDLMPPPPYEYREKTRTFYDGTGKAFLTLYLDATSRLALAVLVHKILGQSKYPLSPELLPPGPLELIVHLSPYGLPFYYISDALGRKIGIVWGTLSTREVVVERLIKGHRRFTNKRR